MKNELISVIMSVYNETIYELKRSMDSILKQSYSNIEFVIVNDNPNNKEIKRYLDSIDDKRVVIVENPKNLGLVSSLNSALSICKGEYIARMDADDFSFAERLEKEKAFLENNDYDVVGCFDIEVSNDKKHYYKKPVYFKDVFKILKKRNCLSHPTWLLKKEVYKKLDGYRDIKYCEDYDFLLRAINNNYKIGNCPQYLLEHYIRDTSISLPNKCLQLLITDYLAKRKANISTDDLVVFINSNNTKKEIEKYNKCTDDLKNKKVVSLLLNKWFYKRLLDKVKYILNF